MHQANCNQGRLAPLVALGRAAGEVTQLLFVPTKPRVRAKSRLPVGQVAAQVGLVRVMVLVPPLRVTAVAGRWVAGSRLPPVAQLSVTVQLPTAMSLRGLAIFVMLSSVFLIQPVPL